jgi:uncharacterized membrane protein
VTRTDAVVWLSVALLLVALGHTHEDALFAGEPPLAEFLAGSALVGGIVVVHLAGLVLARTGRRLGFALSALAGAAWALLFTFAHIGDALTFDWRYGIFSSVLVLGGIVLGVALALAAGWRVAQRG